MGKSSVKKKKQGGEKLVDAIPKQCRTLDDSPRIYDNDTTTFIALSGELKEEGNKLFQRRDCEGALLKYEKALKLLPINHIDVAYLRSNMAACYMQMGISDYPRAVHECNLALEVSPKYTKALIKRARCYEALNRLQLSLRDLNSVLTMEPNNLTALELVERVEEAIESRGGNSVPVPEYIESLSVSPPHKALHDKSRKISNSKSEETKVEDLLEKKAEEERTHFNHMAAKQEKFEGNIVENKIEKQGKVTVERKGECKGKKKKSVEKVGSEPQYVRKLEIEGQVEKQTDDKMVVNEKITIANGDEPKKNVKLVFGDDIRWAQLPVNCSTLNLREIIRDKFQASSAVLVKYKDDEGDMITITSDEELRWAEASTTSLGSIKLYVTEVNPEHDPFYEKLKREGTYVGERNLADDRSVHKKVKDEASVCIEEWIVQFAHLFKNYVGFGADGYLDLHEVGVKLYSEAMEETVCSEEAQPLFDMAAEKFQEMVALALFNWGNVHMAQARKRIHFADDSAEESMCDKVENAYNWAQREYETAGQKYEEAVKIKPNFYEGYLALAQQQFEQAKLAWYYAVANSVDLDSWPSTEVVDLYNDAEANIEKGLKMWEELKEDRLNVHSDPNIDHVKMQKMALDRPFKGTSGNECAEQVMTLISQINVLWGTILYERSIMEFKLGLPVWQECLEVAVEKFELAGASPTDIAVMIKNHCSNETAVEGFKVDEIVQAWNEMDEAKKWYNGAPFFRLEPLLRRRVSKVYDALDHA